MTATLFPPDMRPLWARHLSRTWANRRDFVLHVLDVVLASLGLVVVAPTMAVIVLLILLDDSRPGDLPAGEGWLPACRASECSNSARCGITAMSRCTGSSYAMLTGDDPRSRPGSGLLQA